MVFDYLRLAANVLQAAARFASQQLQSPGQLTSVTVMHARLQSIGDESVFFTPPSRLSVDCHPLGCVRAKFPHPRAHLGRCRGPHTGRASSGGDGDSAAAQPAPRRRPRLVETRRFFFCEICGEGRCRPSEVSAKSSGRHTTCASRKPVPIVLASHSALAPLCIHEHCHMLMTESRGTCRCAGLEVNVA